MSKEPPSKKNKKQNKNAGPHEVKRIPIDVNDSDGRHFRIERWASIYLVIGPEPGLFLFTSFKADSWGAAIVEARRQWNTREKTRRNTWYGFNGKFTGFDEWGKLRHTA